MTGRRELTAAGVVFGIGMGGFLDGILLHQVLQWHHLISLQVPPTDLAALEWNTFWDGVFHLAMYALVIIGLIWIARCVVRTRALFAPRLILGSALIGVGVFHTFDTIVFHWILQLHHIRMVDHWLVYDLGYWIIGLLIGWLGWRIHRSAQTA